MKAPALSRPRLKRSISDNPVVVKEVRTRMRGNRAFILVTAHLTVLALIVALTYVFFYDTLEASRSLEDRRAFGKALFGMVIIMELIIVSFTAPALTSGAISNEHERQTFDLLRVTLLPASRLILGKFLAGLVFLLLLIFTAIPLLSPAFLIGGVLASEIAVALLILLVTAVAFCAVGIFYSTLTRRTLAATVLSYGFAIFMVFGIPMLMLLALFIFGAVFSGSFDRMQPVTVAILAAIVWLLIAVSPLATVIASETALLTDNSLFMVGINLGNGRDVELLSPWIGYVLIYLLISQALLLISIQRVQRLDE